jgi:hypothetical protein
MLVGEQSLEEKVQYLMDRTEIYDLVRYERFCRDMLDWDGLQASFVSGSPVRTTWFDGTIEGFVEGSRAKMSSGSTAKHWIFPAKLKLNGDRGTIESPATIFARQELDGVEYDYFQFCRFFSRLQKTDEGWRLASFEGIYQRDRMDVVNPADTPPIDWDLVATLRPSYRFLAYNQIRQGYDVNPELIGDDRPDLLQAFYDQEYSWLETGK